MSQQKCCATFFFRTDAKCTKYLFASTIFLNINNFNSFEFLKCGRFHTVRVKVGKMYKPFDKENNVIALHDIVNTDFRCL